MKKVIGLICLLFALSASAEPQGRHIMIQGEGVVTAKPDVVEIKFELIAKKDTGLEAKKVVDKIFNDFLSGIDKFSIKKKDISASSILTENNHQYDDNGNEQIIGIIATRTVTVKLLEMSELNRFLDYALEKKMDVVDKINLTSSKISQLKDEARKKAVDDAVRKAKVSAEFFDAKLGPVYSVNYGYSSSYQNYGFHNDAETIIVTASRIDKKDLVQGQYLEAQITFTESVNVIFDLIVD